MDTQNRQRALVVDDNFYNRDLCTLALSHVGYEIEEAENGLEALNILQHRAYDLIILDLLMPVMDGLTVMHELAGLETLKKMTIIVMTANPHMTIHEDVVSRADYIIQKPIDIVEFRKLLERIKSSAQNHQVVS